ncbi:diguanylate cyclase [Paenibacillus filicis]|uniref:Diguanylate cyclase n=1 Tax=Paenibacillus filicis TaxID=669464 RepID=A0ABU9DSD5_9BACL
MIRDFVINASILVASFFFIGQMFKGHPLTRESPWKWKVFGGFCFGLFGVLLMEFSLQVGDGVIADLRHIPLIVAALQGGLIPALVTGFVLIVGRIGLFGVSYPSVSSSIMMLLLSVLFGAIAGRRGLTMPRFVSLNTVGLIVISATITLNLNYAGQLGKLYSVLLYHWAFSSVTGLLSVQVFLYIVRAHASNRKLKESEERYRGLIASSPDATFVMMRDGTISFVNDKGIRLLHAVSRKDIIGRSYFEFVHPSHRESSRKYVEALLNRQLKPELMEQVFVCLDGTEMETELSISLTLYKEEVAILLSVRDVTERKRTEKSLQEALDKLQKLSDLDGLTGIPNRRRLDEYLTRAWADSAANQTRLTVVLFDVDYFKRYNDCYGHLGGDEALRTIAGAAEALMREKGHFVARYGGEEFAAVLKEIPVEEAMEIAEQLRAQIEQLALAHAGSEIADHITVSIGLASVTPDPLTHPEQVLSQADKALYLAKAEGRNRALFDPLASVSSS